MYTIIKKFTAAICCAVLISSCSLIHSSAASGCWYIKRNGNLRPHFPADAEELDRYGCYYVDKRLDDTSDEKRLYLTFDAGYENGNIEKILDVLKEEEVSAAFFILEYLIKKNPELILRMNNEGHTVCNHTANHKNINGLDKSAVRDNLERLERAYLELVGEDMPRYFRFPEGRYSLDTVKTLDELGYKTVFWSFGYEDWDNGKQPDEEYALNKILSNTHNGAVILLHPTSATNAKIMKRLISEWRKMGYSFGTLDELTEK